MMRRALYAGGPVFLLFVPALAAAALGVDISIRAEPIPERAKDVRSERLVPAATEERVRLDGDKLVVQSGARKQILDFGARRKYVVDLDAGTYAEYSLFADAGFRFYEIQNRALLARALEAAKLPRGKAGALLLAEHELSVAHPREPARLERSESAQAVRFEADGLVLFEIGAGGAPLSAVDARALARYFRYLRGGHPRALEELQKRQALPAKVEMLSGPFQSMRSTLVMKAAPLESSPAAALVGLRKTAPADLRGLPKDLADAAFRIGEARPERIEEQARATHARAQALLAAGSLAPGFLAAMEYNLQKGVMAHDLLARYRDAFKASTDLQQTLFPYLGNSRNKEEAARAIEALRAARGKAGEMAYVLGIFEANHHVRMNDFKAAEALFVEALRRNPHIAGAWKDLGDVLFSQWMVPAAWQCWDTGRKLAPGFPSFEQVNRLEEQLLRDLPDYF